MGRKADAFYDELLDQQMSEALNNDFARAVLRMPNLGMGEVREEVFVYFSAMAMQQINVLAAKHGISDPTALSELYQLTRTNLIHGFRLGQNMGQSWKAS